MMTLHAAQLDAFEASVREDFLVELTGYVRRFSPPLYRTLGDERLEAIVRGGVSRAVAHGFTRRGPIRLFLELMLLFGSGFDADPQLPWAAHVLADDSFPNEMYRAGRLEHLTNAYLDEVHGADGEHADAALRRIEADARGLTFGARSLADDVEAALHRIFPQKARALGPDGIRRVVDLADARATAAFGPEEVRGKGVLAILMFSFGSGCLDDPLYPWIGETVANPRSGDGRRRAEALERKAMLWVRAVNAHRAAAS